MDHKPTELTFLEEVQDTYDSPRTLSKGHRARETEVGRYIDGELPPHYPVPAATLRDLAVAIFKQAFSEQS